MPGEGDQMLRRIALVTCLALIAQACVAQQPATLGDDLIENGSFEESPVGPVAKGEVPQGWADEAYGASGQLEIVADGAPGCGQRCLKVTTSALDRRSGLHGPMLTIDPARAYLQSGWMRIEGHKPPGGGLYLGRAWFDADGNPMGSAPGTESNYNYVAASVSPEQWTYYEQLLLPDLTPEDGKYDPDEIPANAASLRIWALSFEWEGVGYFDGLSLCEVDFAAKIGNEINALFRDANVPQIRGDIEGELKGLPADDPVAKKAKALLAKVDALEARLQEREQRPISEWTAELDLATRLIRDLDRMKWELKIEVLLVSADMQATEQ